MRLHRFIGNFDLSASEVVADDAALAHQLARVFRMGVGDAVVLCDGRGNEVAATITAIGKSSVTFAKTGEVIMKTDAPVRVSLYCAMIRREHLELVVEKATECGAARIIPLQTARTVRDTFRADRLAKIAREAAEQCGRTRLPEIVQPMSFMAAIEDAAAADTRVLFDLGGASAAAVVGGSSGDIAVFIGPEGGWDDTERQAAADAGFVTVGLGTLTLRAETAAVIATWIAVHARRF